MRTWLIAAMRKYPWLRDFAEECRFDPVYAFVLAGGAILGTLAALVLLVALGVLLVHVPGPAVAVLALIVLLIALVKFLGKLYNESGL